MYIELFIDIYKIYTNINVRTSGLPADLLGGKIFAHCIKKFP